MKQENNREERWKEWVKNRTEIISEMLDNPDEHGIYPTTQCFRKLDELHDYLIAEAEAQAWWEEQERIKRMPKSKKQKKIQAVIDILKNDLEGNYTDRLIGDLEEIKDFFYRSDRA